MLDVHPPHAPTHTWRDFFIHIATIVVGLCIAIGLEQTVEFFHHRHQLREIHEALHREHDENVQQFASNTDELAKDVKAQQNNLIVLMYLRAHPGTPRAKLPGVLLWRNRYSEMSDIAWRAAQSPDLLPLLSSEEVSSYANLYGALSYMNQVEERSWFAISRARMYNFSDPDPTHMTPARLDQEIELTEEVLADKYNLGVCMGDVGKSFPDFSHAPSLDALQDLFIAAAPLTPSQQGELQHAVEITQARMAMAPASKN